MSRSLTPSVVNSMMVRESSEGYVLLLTISHADFTPPIRMSSASTNFTSRGNVFLPFPFDISIPPSGTGSTRVDFSVQNVDKKIVEGVRLVTPGTARPKVLMELVTMSNPNTVEVGPFDLDMKDARWDNETVVSELSYENFLYQKYPVGDRNPAEYPGSF